MTLLPAASEKTIFGGGTGNDVIAGAVGYIASSSVYGEIGWAESAYAFAYANGEEGNDVLVGGDGFNHLVGGTGDDVVTAGSSNYSRADGWACYDHWGFYDSAYSHQYDNLLEGGLGSDLLIGGLLDDIMAGGNGADTFIIAADAGSDRITDFDLSDTLVFENLGLNDLQVFDDGDDLVVVTGDNAEVRVENAAQGYNVTQTDDGVMVTLNEPSFA